MILFVSLLLAHSNYEQADAIAETFDTKEDTPIDFKKAEPVNEEETLPIKESRMVLALQSSRVRDKSPSPSPKKLRK